MNYISRTTATIIGAGYVVFVLMISANAAVAGQLRHVGLSTKRASIKAGEPATFKLTYRYEEPRVSGAENVILRTIQHGAIVQIADSNGTVTVPQFPVHPSVLNRHDEEGLVYSNNFALFYNHLRRSGLLFDRPGRYEITLLGTEILGAEAPKPLIISVEPASKSVVETLALLDDPNDYAFLEHGSHEYRERRPERMARLARAVKKGGGSLLEKWAAGRLGVEHFGEFSKKRHKLNESGKTQKRPDVKDESFKKAQKYLNIAYALPDQVPIREETVHKLAVVEFRQGNKKRAMALLDELTEKYPYGEYGRMAARHKEEMQGLELNPIDGERPLWARAAVIVGGVAVFGILAAIIYLIRKGSRKEIG